MVTKNYSILLGLLFSAIVVNAQEWEKTASTPEGGGITEIVVNSAI